MKPEDIDKVFCEILSGLMVLILLVPTAAILNFDLNIIRGLNSFDIKVVVAFIIKYSSITNATIIIITSYIIGLMVDALGLFIGELFLDKLICKNEPTSDDSRAFWKGVPNHVLAYRNEQWIYYSCYRNILLLLIPNGVLWAFYFWKYSRWYGIAVIAISIFLGVVLWRCMSTLLLIYYNITKSIRAKRTQPIGQMRRSSSVMFRRGSKPLA